MVTQLVFSQIWIIVRLSIDDVDPPLVFFFSLVCDLLAQHLDLQVLLMRGCVLSYFNGGGIH